MGGVVKGITNVLSGDYGGDQINAGLAAQQRAGGQAQQQLGQTWKEQKEIAQPWQQAGQSALGQLAGGKFMDNWQQDPGYKFRLDQGTQAIQGSAAARGLNGSGATMKALAGYGQNLASQEYQNVYNRESGRLTGLANLGAGMTGNLMQGAQNYGNQVAGITTGLGNAQAAASMAHAQGQQNMTNGLMSLGGSAMAAFSDKRVKKNIKSVAKEDLKEFKSTIKPYSFNYTDEKYGRGDWAGVMAQDLEKSKLGRTVVEEIDGVKAINLAKLASLNLAIMASDDKE